MAYIKNDDTVNHTWVGQLITPGSYYQIQPHEKDQWANDSQLLTDIGAGDAVVAEDSSGNKDFTDVAEGINFLKGIIVEVKRDLGWHYSLESLAKAGGSVEMSVDGSTTNVIFKWDVPTGEVWEILSIQLFLLDPGTMAHNVFGGMATSITNGLSVIIKKNGTDFKIKDIKDNVDVYMSFPTEQHVGNSASGFLDNDDYFSGCLRFYEPIQLIGDDGDLVKVVVKDNLTAIERLRATAFVRKKI